VIKRAGEDKPLARYYLSGRPPNAHTPAQWLGLIRSHWAGFENRNHWRRDALFGEDHSRTRNVNTLAKLALLRSAVLRLFAFFFLPSPHPPASKLSTQIPLAVSPLPQTLLKTLQTLR